MSSYCVLLSLIVFLPTLGALALAVLIPKDKPEAAKLLTLAITIAVFVLTVWMAFPAPDSQSARFELGHPGMQDVFNYSWIPSFNIYYFMGVDGISFPLVILTTFIFALSMWASWPINKHVKAYCILFLLLETGVLGVFLALDFFLFYVFWEVMLLPMYFLIGIWGGPRREYAAIKFFIYTFLGGVFMLIAILALYFTSDLHEFRRLARLPTPWAQMHLHEETLQQVQSRGALPVSGDEEKSLLISADYPGADYEEVAVAFQPDASLDEGQVKAVWDPGQKKLLFHVQDGRGRVPAASLRDALHGGEAGAFFTAAVPADGGDVATNAGATLRVAGGEQPVHTFNLLALMQLGQHTTMFHAEILGLSIQTWAFLLLFVGFAIKVPVVPVHTWLPDAHVEAPTPISMILAGILLKLGGYGIIRICYPICPEAGYYLAPMVCTIGVVSMVYGAFAAMAQRDFKRLVAYSSVSHMGYVVLGLGVWSATADNFYAEQYWQLGMNGAMFQMVAHGLSSAGMFFLVGVVYERVHHRNLNEFGGLFGKMPVYSGLAIGIFFAALGLPGLCGFIGEVFVTLSVWKYNYLLAVLAAFVVILTAGYILWTIQRVYLGPEYKGPHGEALTPMTYRERCIAVPLLAFAILLGVYPRAVFDYMTPSVNQVVDQMTAWDKRTGASLPEPLVREASADETPGLAQTPAAAGAPDTK